MPWIRKPGSTRNRICCRIKSQLVILPVNAATIANFCDLPIAEGLEQLRGLPAITLNADTRIKPDCFWSAARMRNKKRPHRF